MIYLLDTNVISETMKDKPNKNVLLWFQMVDMRHLALSVLSLGEIRKGAESIVNTIKKQKLVHWLEIELPKTFHGRIINIDEKVSDKWGYITVNKSVPTVDGLIAASALVHNQKLVTRNVKDFKPIPGLEIINPCEN